MHKSPFKYSMTGEEIKNWIWDTTRSDKKTSLLTSNMKKFFNLDDNKIYILKMCDGAPIAFEVKEKGKKYEIHCPD